MAKRSPITRLLAPGRARMYFGHVPMGRLSRPVAFVLRRQRQTRAGLMFEIETVQTTVAPRVVRAWVTDTDLTLAERCGLAAPVASMPCACGGRMSYHAPNGRQAFLSCNECENVQGL